MKIHVLTGGPTNGKSTLINLLKDAGHFVLNETAREVLEERKRFSATKEEVLFRELEIFRRQKKKETEILEKGKEREYFLDRSLVDCIAYCEYYLGYIPDEVACLDLTNKYSEIFLLERLPFVADGTRIEKDDKEAEKVHRLLIKAYERFGYKTISVPVFPEGKIIERLGLVLSHTFFHNKNLKGGEENGRIL